MIANSIVTIIIIIISYNIYIYLLDVTVSVYIFLTVQVDRLKRKHELLNIVKKLTDGVVGSKISWSAVKETPNKSSNYLVDELSHSENKSADTEPCHPRTYSLQESCDLLTSSYDDLYDDNDDDETVSVETGSHTDHEALLKAKTDSIGGSIDSVDAPLNQSFMSSSGFNGYDGDETVSVETESHDEALLEAQTDSVGGYTGSVDAPLNQSFMASSNLNGGETVSVETWSHTDHDEALLKAQTDIVGDPVDSVDSPLNESLTSSSSVNDDSAVMAECTADSDSDGEEPSSLEDKADLYAPDVWKSYYGRLEKIGSSMVGREGWPNFDAVFMISAAEGDGVLDIKVIMFLLFRMLLLPPLFFKGQLF